MSFLLVTNDDGVDSPALPPLVRALSRLAPVRAVVPNRERSWIGKAITRFEPVQVERVERDGVEIWAADGYPADCTQLGVHSLFGDKPRMVVSGINVGFNHGLAFFLGSGTVGAAAEGWIAGLPAVAFSAGHATDHRGWARRAWQKGNGAAWTRAADLAADVVRDLLREGYPDGVDLLNVNFPEHADRHTRREVTALAKVGYDALFRRETAGRFVHDFGGRFRLDEAEARERLAGTDLGASRAGVVSITPVRLAHSAPLPDSLRQALERPGPD